jgi:hypothetical protein
MEQDEDYLMRVLAPTVYPGSDVSKMKYIWVINPETNEEVLLSRREQEDANNGQEEYFEEDDYSYEYGEYDDDESGGFNKFAGYKTMDEIKINWLKDQFEEVNLSENQKKIISRKFVLGKEILQNVNVIFDKYITSKKDSWSSSISKLKPN